MWKEDVDWAKNSSPRATGEAMNEEKQLMGLD
jgi:hypothetical protein